MVSLRSVLKSFVSVSAASAILFSASGHSLADQQADVAELKQLFAETGLSSGGGGGGIFAIYSQMLSQIDRDGDGLEAAEVDLFEDIKEAELRLVAAQMRLRMDLDGDLSVSREEMEKVLRFQHGRGASDEASAARVSRDVERAVTQQMAADSDGNGKIEGREIYVISERREHRARNQFGIEMAKVMLKLDPDKNGTVTEAEAMLILGNAFGSGEDLKTLMQKKRVEQKATGINPASSSCPQMKATPSAKAVVIGAYEGGSLSTVTVAGQTGETSAVHVTIEAGTEPLDIVMTAYDPVIWQFSGAVERVAQLYVSSLVPGVEPEKIAAGVTGINKSKITFFQQRNCFPYFTEAKSNKADIARARARHLLGREADQLIASYSIQEVAIPSGKIKPGTAAQETEGLTIVMEDKVFVLSKDGKVTPLDAMPRATTVGALRAELLRSKPGGIVKIEASQVISEVKPETYEVMPRQAGLIQLLINGSLTTDESSVFRVQKAMRYPPDMKGGLRGRFFVPRGVPVPEGDPGHSCVFSEAKGRYIAGACPNQ